MRTWDDGSALDPAVMAAKQKALHARVLRFLRTKFSTVRTMRVARQAGGTLEN